ncbi:uncharacterized protein LOC121754567 [Salvia splendens]|uniref:uncharacterized protein LOC121754567 n=1 Tax=Salvia splendens TaxID=180675 RepID=UPI001C26582E|nr:uncharacterized protein LOC121754567 [Salvia splendens]
MQRPRTVRRLVDEEEPEEPKSQEAVKEKEAKEDSRQRGERKRKGKGSVFTPLKRSRPTNEGVIITDASEPASPLTRERDEGSDAEEQELRWTQRSRRQQGRPTISPSTIYSPQHVPLDQDNKAKLIQATRHTTKDTTSSRPLQREVEKSKAIPTKLASDVSENSLPTTLTFSREELLEMIQSLNKEVDPALFLAKVANKMGEPLEEKEEVESAEGPTIPKNGVLDIVRQIDTEVEPSSRTEIPEETQAESIPMETATVNEHTKEAEQPLLTHE